MGAIKSAFYLGNVLSLTALPIQLPIHQSPSSPHALPSIPSSIPFNIPIHTPLQSHHFSIIYWLVLLLWDREQWESSNSGTPLSYPAVNNAIRVTDCQEGAGLRLPLMCVCVCTPDTYDSSNAAQCPLTSTVVPLSPAEVQWTGGLAITVTTALPLSASASGYILCKVEWSM